MQAQIFDSCPQQAAIDAKVSNFWSSYDHLCGHVLVREANVHAISVSLLGERWCASGNMSLLTRLLRLYARMDAGLKGG